jgi:hypothetical protein
MLFQDLMIYYNLIIRKLYDLLFNLGLFWYKKYSFNYVFQVNFFCFCNFCF